LLTKYSNNTTYFQKNLREQSKVSKGDRYPIYLYYILISCISLEVRNNDNSIVRSVLDGNI